MKVLLLDDEKLALDALQMVVEPMKDLVSHVYTAGNVEDAKQILQREMVDILVTDIEMPMGSGLALLRWIREENYEVECIFQTCHEEFSYAREAMSLGSAEYLVKPVTEEDIRPALEKAAKNIETRKIMKNEMWYQESIKKYRGIMEEVFLSELLRGTWRKEDTEESLCNICRRYGLILQENEQVMLICLNVYRKGKMVENWEQDIYDFALRNVIEECFGIQEKRRICQTNMGTGLAYAVLVTEKEKDRKSLQEAGSKLVHWVYNELDTDIQVIMEEYTELEFLPRQFEKLRKMQEESVWQEACCICRIGEENVQDPNYQAWGMLLNRGKKKELLSQVLGYIDSVVENGGMTVPVLNRLFENMGEILKKCRSGEKLYSEDYARLARDAMKTREKTENFFYWVLLESQESTKQEETLGNQIMNFIAEHISKEITRKMLEDEFHLNRDYLNRQFKKETGQSLAEYIVEQKMKIAKELLTATDLPVGEVGYWVGYENFSYFSRYFKKMTGESPAAYRQKYRQE